MILYIGKNVGNWIAATGSISRFFAVASAQLFSDTVRFRLRVGRCLDQVFNMGVVGTLSTLISMGFLTSVMVLELSFHMNLIIHQDAMVPSFTSVLLLRELGPVVTAILAASRIGGSIASELATLKTTGQIDALVLYGIDPVRLLVLPRIIGSFISLVVLTIVASGGALIATGFVTASFLGLTPPVFFSHLFLFTDPLDFGCLTVKAAIFGLVIPAVAAYHGLNAERGSRGVGSAATRSVVQNSVAIILLDFLVSSLWYAV